MRCVCPSVSIFLSSHIVVRTSKWTATRSYSSSSSRSRGSRGNRGSGSLKQTPSTNSIYSCCNTHTAKSATEHSAHRDEQSTHTCHQRDSRTSRAWRESSAFFLYFSISLLFYSVNQTKQQPEEEMCVLRGPETISAF